VNGKRSSRFDSGIGERLRLRREQRRVSRKDLAGHLGVSVQQLQKYESGANRIGAGRLFEAAALLDVEVTYFFEDLPVSKPLRARMTRSNQASELFLAIHGIADPLVRRRLLSLITALTSARAEMPPRSAWRIRPMKQRQTPPKA
jgi:transcriptional regulator with XRE-family HTH domain